MDFVVTPTGGTVNNMPEVKCNRTQEHGTHHVDYFETTAICTGTGKPQTSNSAVDALMRSFR